MALSGGNYGMYGGLGVNPLVAGLNNGCSSSGFNPLVAGLAGQGTTCFGPPFFNMKLAAFRGVPVVICTEDGRCCTGQIIEVCGDYLTFNMNGRLEIIPIEEITRVSLAPTGIGGFEGGI